MQNKILLLGHDGYLGRNIYKALKSNHHIFVLSKDEIIEFIKTENLKYNFEFDFFINCIVNYSNESVSKVIEGNIYYPLKICEKILKSQFFTAVYFDSFYSKFYNDYNDSMYILSKITLVNWAKLFHKSNPNMTSYILRLEHLVGKNESVDKFNGWLIENLKKNENIKLSKCQHKLDFIHIDDIIKILIILINQKPYNLKFNILEIGSGVNYKLKDFVIKLKNKLKSKSKISFNKRVEKYKTMSSISKNKNLLDLGWKPISDLDKIIDSIL